MVAVDWYGGLSKWLYTGNGLNSRLVEQEGDWEVGCFFYSIIVHSIPHLY